MKININRYKLFICLLIVSISVMTGCGYKTDPVAPKSKAVETVKKKVVKPQDSDEECGECEEDKAKTFYLPPLPPINVDIMIGSQTTKIFWDKSVSPDLRGYNVYRRSENNNNFKLIGTVEAEYNIFEDQTGKAGDVYYVTALSAGSLPLESKPSVKVQGVL